MRVANNVEENNFLEARNYARKKSDVAQSETEHMKIWLNEGAKWWRCLEKKKRIDDKMFRTKAKEIGTKSWEGYFCRI